jgi:hypothetical protein
LCFQFESHSNRTSFRILRLADLPGATAKLQAARRQRKRDIRHEFDSNFTERSNGYKCFSDRLTTGAQLRAARERRFDFAMRFARLVGCSGLLGSVENFGVLRC